MICEPTAASLGPCHLNKTKTNTFFSSVHEDFRATSRTDSLQWWTLFGTTAFTWITAAVGLYLRFSRGCRANAAKGPTTRQDNNKLELDVNHFEHK